jgi:hypothetical protein
LAIARLLLNICSFSATNNINCPCPAFGRLLHGIC